MALTTVEKEAIQEDLQAGMSPSEVRKRHKLTASQLNYYVRKYSTKETPQQPQGKPSTPPPEVDPIGVDETINNQEQEEKTNTNEQPKNEYMCPACEAVFEQPYTYCPSCGVHLEW